MKHYLLHDVQYITFQENKLLEVQFALEVTFSRSLLKGNHSFFIFIISFRSMSLNLFAILRHTSKNNDYK